MDVPAKAMLRALLALPVAALGTLHGASPYVSMVPVVPAEDGSGFLIHASRLAQHTRDLLADAHVSLMFMAPLGQDQDPLALPRLTLQGEAGEIPTNSDRHFAAAATYRAHFPQAEMTLGLGDFSFFLIRPQTGRLVSGFGRALTLDADQIRAGLTRTP